MTQELKLNHLLMPALRSGVKKMTIRKGNRKITVGEQLRLVNADDPSDHEEVFVRAAAVCPLDELTDFDAQSDGFDDWDALFEGLKEYYPDLVEDDNVTLIYWN